METAKEIVVKTTPFVRTSSNWLLEKAPPLISTATNQIQKAPLYYTIPIGFLLVLLLRRCFGGGSGGGGTGKTMKAPGRKNTQHIFDRLSELQQEEKSLVEMNKSLRIKLEELGVALPSWHSGIHEQPSQPEGFFRHVDCNNTLPISYRYNSVPPEHAAPSTHDAAGVVHGWMV